MIAGCPKCSARYRVDADRIGPEGAKLRCTKCSAVFLVRAPQPKSVAPAAAESSETPPQPTPDAASQSEAPLPDYDRARLVLVADPDEARGKRSAAAVEAWGLQAHLVHDGVEAMMAIQRLLPSAVVLDAALPKMFGFQVCEVVKRNDSLRETVVVLVGAIHHQTRYRRDPSELYGADVYIEQPDLPDGLEPILRERGMPMEGVAPSSSGSVSGSASDPMGAAVPDPAPTPVAEPTPPAPPAPSPVSDAAPPAPEPSFDEPTTGEDEAPEFEFESPAPESTPEPASSGGPAPAADEDPEKAEERERARRLARIAVSEMLLYQPEKFEQATRDGNLEQVLDLEIQEARALLRQRISEEVRAEADFVMDELQRVAAERSAQA